MIIDLIEWARWFEGDSFADERDRYICEISPPKKRGPLTTGPQLGITLGLMVGYFTCYGTAKVESSLSWRAPFIVLACLSTAFSVSSFLWLVPSPRWLILRGRQSEAAEAWDVLGVGHAEREKAEIESGAEGHGITVSADGPATKSGFLDVFSRDVRTRTGLAVFMMGMQQLSGIDGVLYVSSPRSTASGIFPDSSALCESQPMNVYALYGTLGAPNITDLFQYAPLLFRQAGLASSEAAFLASGVSAIVIFSVTIPALFLADKWGRRHSTIYGGIGISIIMFLIGGLYAGNAVHGTFGAGRWVVIVSIYIFAVIYCTSWAVGIKIYAAEIQPQRTRASATSLAHGSNWVANFLVALTTPILLARSSFAAYFLFGGCALLTAIVCAAFMPETKGKSLDEIDEVFRFRSPGSRSLGRAIRKAFGRITGAFAA